MRIAKSSEFEPKHLLSSEQIKLGSFYTPRKIVDIVHRLIKVYKNYPKAVIFDNAAGAGAFIKTEDKIVYKAAECDPIAGRFLKEKMSQNNLFIENSISNVNREKYNIARSDFLIQIGNPPYNDTTSVYRNGQKGKNICDADLFDRDLGISFLKSYNKLQSNIVCVLHPLSYLIKESNFKRLQPFSKNYRLKKGILFSSSLFQNVSNMSFPIVIALYKKNPKGMKYNDIQNFKFSIIESKKAFRLNNYVNVDSFIRKYPPRKADVQISDIGIYYHTFRDINSLIRNRGFHIQKGRHSIVVNLKDFYKYAYIYSFKRLFRPEDMWMYGNLSPLGHKQLIEDNKKLFLIYTFLSEKKIFFQLENKVMSRILKFYSIKNNELQNLSQIKKSIFSLINSLVF
ncbi:MAG: N-6 DNA methylase [Oligoflexia bacterium]|nr:N-6 DNA methylase [Oligoflexia bacterium]